MAFHDRCRFRVGTAFASLALLALAGCATPPRHAEDLEGLVAQPSKAFDAVYMRPGVDYKQYDTLALDPVQVSFDKDWDPNRTERDISRHLSTEDIQRMKDEMAATFREIFVKELTDGGYQVVEKPGADTLRATAQLADVYINAPDVMAPGRVRTYTMESGRMTLVMDVRDGVTGQLLARVVDKKISDNFDRLEITNSVTNSADFRRAVKDWAARLRRGLDTVRSEAYRGPAVL